MAKYKKSRRFDAEIVFWDEFGFSPEILIEEHPAYALELNPEPCYLGNVKQGLKNSRLS